MVEDEGWFGRWCTVTTNLEVASTQEEVEGVGSTTVSAGLGPLPALPGPDLTYLGQGVTSVTNGHCLSTDGTVSTGADGCGSTEAADPLVPRLWRLHPTLQRAFRRSDREVEGGRT